MDDMELLFTYLKVFGVDQKVRLYSLNVQRTQMLNLVDDSMCVLDVS